MTMALLTGGTKTRTVLQISDEQAPGAQLTAYSNLIFSTVELSTLKSKLDFWIYLCRCDPEPRSSRGGFQAATAAAACSDPARENTPIQMALRVFPAPDGGSCLRKPADGFAQQQVSRN
jgi:hypothetical protein